MQPQQKTKKSNVSKILIGGGLALVVFGFIQASVQDGNQLNIFIGPGALLMLLGAVMPSKKSESKQNPGSHDTRQ